MVLDLGVSSFQFDEPARGFSFREDGPLDMRMSLSGESAADLVNSADERTLAQIIARYGEEKNARRIARAIIAARPVTGTAQLAEIVSEAQGPAALRHAIHPATRTFQALRIHVNDELGELERGLEAALHDPEAARAAWWWSRSTAWKTASSSISSSRHSDAAPRASRHVPDTAPRQRAAFQLLTTRPQTPSRGRDRSQSPRPLRQAARRPNVWRHRRRPWSACSISSAWR